MATYRWNLKSGELKEMAKTEEEPVLEAKNFGRKPLDLSYSYKEMTVKEIHRGSEFGPINQDNGMAFVFEDEFGNHRVGRISFNQLNNTLENIGLRITTR